MGCLTKQDVGGCGCGGAPPQPPCITCGSNDMPGEFYITDSFGSFTATPLFPGVWATGLEGTSPTVHNVGNCPSGNCTNAGGLHDAPTSYGYIIECLSVGHMVIDRYWRFNGSFGSNYYCPIGCVGPSQGISGSNAPVTCGSISWSGTLGAITTNPPDPVGLSGTVTFSQ